MTASVRRGERIREALNEAFPVTSPHYKRFDVAMADLDALLAALAAAEQEAERLRRCLAREEEIGDTLTARAAELETALREAGGMLEFEGNVQGAIDRILSALASSLPDRDETE